MMKNPLRAQSRNKNLSKSTPSGFVIINKPSGITSFRVLGPIKKTFGTKRVGHAGTLDQNASGLIIAGVGISTRLLSQIVVMDKVYECKAHLGCSTDTLEWTGQEVAVDADGARTVEEIEKILPRFLGAIAQIPPQYSAIKIKGKRASDIVISSASSLTSAKVRDTSISFKNIKDSPSVISS